MIKIQWKRRAGVLSAAAVLLLLPWYGMHRGEGEPGRPVAPAVEKNKAPGGAGEESMDESGMYIDGSAGPHGAAHGRWGIPDDCFFAITYKNIGGDDVPFLSKAKLLVLDVSQMRAAEEVRSRRASVLRAPGLLRSFGYCDGAGISMSLPEFINKNGVYMVRNPLEQALMVGGRLYGPGEIIEGSERWFLRDALGAYYTYWFKTGVMADVANPGYREWYRSFRVNRVMGIFDHGRASSAGERVLRDTGKSWAAGQWKNYFAGIGDEGSTRWMKIIDNTATDLTLDSPPGEYTGGYVINAAPLRGFDGVFLDDIWDGILHENEKKSLTESGKTTGSGANYIIDTTKNWEKNQWKGYRAAIGSGEPRAVTGNDSNKLYFRDRVKAPQGTAYTIKAGFEWDTGSTYPAAMAAFIRETAGYIEKRAAAVYGPERAADGTVVLNTWLDDWDAYRLYVDAATGTYRNFAMFEALQSTWDMANEVTKQYRIYDWRHVLDRWKHMKVTGERSGKNLRLAVLGYPCTQQMFLSHIAGSLMLADFSGNAGGDIITAGNITLDDLYYDMVMAKNLGAGEGSDAVSAFGGPLGPYSVLGNDLYSVIRREFDGAVIFYNPSRMHRVIGARFDTDVAEYQTGREIPKNTDAKIFLLPRSAHFYFKKGTPGGTAFDFLRDARLFTCTDSNAAWVIFTEEGARLVNGTGRNAGHYSVWMDRGRSHHRRFVLEGNRKAPAGPPERLFHAGDGRTTEVRGFDPGTVMIKIPPSAASVRLGEFVKSGDALPVYAVVRVSDGVTGTALTPGTDYRIEYIDDPSAPGAGRMDARIHFLTARGGKSIRVAYYAQDLDKDGLPDREAEIRETGIMYREASDPLFKTGGIDREECTVVLKEGVHFYLIPEQVRWKWDYRYGIALPKEYRKEPLRVSLNDVLKNSSDPGAKAIHWGVPELENMVLVDPEKTFANTLNGYRADYKNVSIRKPRVLIYGFREDPADMHGKTLTVTARRYNKWRIESRLEQQKDTRFGEIAITGDYTEKGGAWGSIRGYLKATGKTLAAAQEYFDAVIICENFIENSAGSPSGKAQYGSWLEEEDYLFLKSFGRKGAGKLIVDRRCGANSFVWWGGRAPVRHELLNRGTDLNGDGRPESSDLTDVFGVYSYGGMDLEAPSGAVKPARGRGIDLRIVDAVKDITDQYAADRAKGVFPAYNPWENGADYLMYIPRSAGNNADAGHGDGSWTAGRLESLTPAEKPEALLPYEEAYGGRIRRFARDFNTGLDTGYAFAGEKGGPPVVVWFGAESRDIELLADRWEPTRLIFNEFSGSAGKKLYLYYNAPSDMLQIGEGDIGNALPCPFGMGAYGEREFTANRPAD